MTDSLNPNWSPASVLASYNIEDYDNNLALAVTAIGVTACILKITDVVTISDDLTIPSNICLEFIPPGKCEVADDMTLTIQGDVIAHRYQIFSGVVELSGTDKLCPEWWGEDLGDTNVTLAMNNSTLKDTYTKNMIIYGTGDPPDANDYPEGTLFVQYV
jgi:hypothetical protein